jgi:hypothetical protein
MLSHADFLGPLSGTKAMEGKLVAIVEGLHYEVHRRQANRRLDNFLRILEWDSYLELTFF